MASLPKPVRGLRFGVFEVDLQAGELRKSGVRQKLPGQSFQVLQLLLEHPNEVVTREEFRERLWPGNTFVDYELALKKAIHRVREALGDSAENPRFVETVPHRGYRFLGAVEPIDGLAAGSAAPAAREERVRAQRRGRLRFWVGLGASAAVIAAGAAAWLARGWPAYSFHPRDFVLLTDFENKTGDARFDDALLTAFTIDLEQSRYANVFPRTRLPAVLKRMQKSGNERITPQLGLEICQRENIRGLIAASITRTGQEYALSAELVDPQTGAPVRSYSERSSGEGHVLDALDTIAGRIRADLGESLYQIHQASKPLPQVTTASLTALKEYAEGMQLWHRGKYDDALAQYQSATAADSEFAMAHAALGNAYYSHIYYRRDLGRQEYEKALALASHTTDRERLEIQAKSASSMGHTADADRLYRLYLSEYPDDSGIRYAYARVLRMHGQEREAIEQDKEIVRVAPNDSNAYIDMATAYKTLGSFSEALSAYAKAFQIEPNLLHVQNVNQEYGFTLVANGEEDKAKQAFNILLSEPDTHAAGVRACALLEMYHGHYANAERYAENALRTDQGKGNSSSSFSVARDHFLLAVLARGQGDRAKQLQELAAALVDFKNLGVRVEYGSLVGQEYARAGALSKAREMVSRIEPLADPNNQEQSGYVLLLKGEVAAASGNFEEAEKLLTLTDPEYGTSVLNLAPEALAHAYFQAGKMDQAITSYNRFLSPFCRPLGWPEAQQRCPAARLELAASCLARGDRAQAERTLAPLLSLWKDADASLPMRKQMLELEARLTP